MNEQKLWFKAKQYGWGWYPSSWQGWVLTILATYAIIAGSWSVIPGSSLHGYLLAVALRIVPPIIFLIVICYLKGERPGWRWGKVDEIGKSK